MKDMKLSSHGCSYHIVVLFIYLYCLRGVKRGKRKDQLLGLMSRLLLLYREWSKGKPDVIKLSLCAGVRKRIEPQVFIVPNLIICLYKRLFPRLEPVTSWSHGKNVVSYFKVHLPYRKLSIKKKQKNSRLLIAIIMCLSKEKAKRTWGDDPTQETSGFQWLNAITLNKWE